MKQIEKWKTWTFVGSLAGIAIIINTSWEWRWRGESYPSRPTFAPVEQPARPTVPANSHSVERESEPALRRSSQIEIEERLRADRVAREEEMRQREQQLAARKAAEEAAERRHRAEEAAAERARYLARYLNSDVIRKTGTKSVALVAVSENGKFNRALSTALIERLKADGIQILPAFFKSEFVSDGLFNTAFTEPDQIFKKLELANSLDAVLLARQKVQYSTSPALENLITATMELELTAISVPTSAESQSWSFRAPGPGFKQTDARAAAEERIIKQIAKDTKMSLNAVFPNN